MTEHIDTDELATQINRLMRIRIPLLAAIVFNIYLLTGVSATAKRPPQRQAAAIKAIQQDKNEQSVPNAAPEGTPPANAQGAAMATTREGGSQTPSEATPQIDFASVDAEGAVQGFQNVASSINRVARLTGLANSKRQDGSLIQRGIGGLLKTMPKTLEAESGSDNGIEGQLSNDKEIEIPPVVNTVNELITITNPKANGGPVSFKLGTEIVTLSAGESIDMPANVFSPVIRCRSFAFN